MNRLNHLCRDGERMIIDGATASVALNPDSVAGVLSWIGSGIKGPIPEIEINAWADGTQGLTLVELFGGSLRAGAIADDAVEAVTAVTNALTLTAHGLNTGAGPIQFTTTGVLPAGMALATDYYAIKLDDDNIAVALSLADALNGTQVDITGVGSGTHTLVDTAETMRVKWSSYGLLGPASDGTIALTAYEGYVVQARMSARTIMFAISAVAADANAFYFSVAPVMEAG